jgi:ATP-dependent RNA helicase DeaD
MTNFADFGLSDIMMESLNKMGFTTATPIQCAAIPMALQGRDILGSAQTGTGKTAAFSIPMIEMLLRDETKTALVLTPTRELAKQVLDAIRDMIGKQQNMKTAFIIGGEPYGKQFAQLKNRPRIIVGTPGRINDHLDKKTMDLSNAGFLVLDETDRMLDMGFGVQLDRIRAHLPQERQTLLFSATMPQEIVQVAKKYLTNPERISMGDTNVIAPKIKTEVIRINHEKKHDEMVRQLNTHDGTVIIFVKTKYGTEKMAKRLREEGFSADALHGDLRQRKRDQVMRSYREKKFRILCATDIAARGLDVPHIELVINHDLPQVAEDYIHRMGRTARAGAEGSAISFVSPADNRMWRDIERLLGIKSNDNGDQRRGGKSHFGQKKPFEKKGRWKKTGGPDGRSFEGKKRDDRNESGEKKKSWGDKPRFEKASDGAPKKKTWGDKPRFEKSEGGKPAGKKTWGDKPRYEKSEGGKPAGKKTWGDKPTGAAKPSGFKKKFGAKPTGAKPNSNFQGKPKPNQGRKRA